jgi:hypothetical protein
MTEKIKDSRFCLEARGGGEEKYPKQCMYILVNKKISVKKKSLMQKESHINVRRFSALKIKCGLHRAHHRKEGKSNFTVEKPDKHYLSQLIKVNTNIRSC